MPQVKRVSKKVSKHEALARQKEVQEYHTKGKGLYVFRNRSSFGTLQLPKPIFIEGRRITTVGPNQEWQGDDYFMQLVHAHEAIFVREIMSPEEEKAMKLNEENKLICDQPDTVTAEGTVEHVVQDEPQTLVETPQDDKDVLLNEDPVDGVEIITD